MILTKIMTGNIDDVNGILNGKYGLKYIGRDLDAMKSIADVYSKRSLKDFQDALVKYHHGIYHYINELYIDLC
jgi:26S proteasome regulatory subunit N6